ncbi:MAG: oligosaccharide flippase family protein [Acidobacteriota bacterium]
MKKQLSHQIFWGATWLNIANGASMAMGFLQQIVFVRCMGLSQYGSMQIAVAAFEVAVAFFDFNLYYSAIRYGGEALGRGDQRKFEEVFSAALQIKAILAALLLVMATVVWGIGASYRGTTLGIPFLILASNYLFSSLLGYATTLYNTEKRFGVVSLQNAAMSFATSIAMMTAAFLRGTVVSVLLGQMIATFIVATIALFVVRRKIYFRRIRRTVLNEVAVYAGQFAISSIMKRILGKTDTLIVGYFLTTRDVGLYRIAQTFASPIYNAISPLWNVLFPIVAELSGKEDYPKLMTLFQRGSRLLTVAAIPAAGFGSLLIAQFLLIAYKVDAPEAVSTSLLLFWASAISATIPMCPPIIRVFRNDVATWYSVVATVLNTMLDLLLVPYIGILGCGIATLMVVSLGATFMYVYVHRFLSARTPPAESSPHLFFFAAAIGLMIFGWMHLHAITAAGAAALVVAAFAFRMISLREIRQLFGDLRR